MANGECENCSLFEGLPAPVIWGGATLAIVLFGWSVVRVLWVEGQANRTDDSESR